MRLVPAVVYLNDVPKGGKTGFGRLGLEVNPQKGQGLLFFPADAQGLACPARLCISLAQLRGCMPLGLLATKCSRVARAQDPWYEDWGKNRNRQKALNGFDAVKPIGICT
jgi:hypothetical protein